MTDLLQIFRSSTSKAQFAADYFAYLSDLFTVLDFDIVEKIIDLFIEASENEKTIYFLGNGGSAATSSHFASDLAINTLVEGQKPFRAISLADNIASITCIGNDAGFDQLFVRQLEILMNPGDVVIGLSVSGNSTNVIKGLEYAKSNGGKTIACTGFDGGKLGSLADIHFHIPTNIGEYGPTEDIFQILDHLIYTYLRLDRVGSLVHES